MLLSALLSFLLSLLDKILRLFGSSEQKLRWKRHQRQVDRKRSVRRKSNVDQHLKYEHKTCQACGAILDRDANVCHVCDARQASWRSVRLQKRLNKLLPKGESATGLILVLNGLVFLVAFSVTGDLWAMGDSGTYTSIRFGSNYGPLMTGGNEWWRLITYNFLHVGGLLHFAFNTYALLIVGPVVERWYGSSRMLVLYLFTGVLGGVGSHLASPMVSSGGASGAVMGLMGLGIVAGHLERSASGRGMRNLLLRWVAFVAIFGLIPNMNVDNWAHIGGLLGGLLTGFLTRPDKRASARARVIFRGLGIGCIVLILGSLVLVWQSGRDFPDQSDEHALRTEWLSCTEAWDRDDVATAAQHGEALHRILLTGPYREWTHQEAAILASGLWDLADRRDRAANIRSIEHAAGGFASPDTPVSWQAVLTSRVRIATALHLN